MRQVGLGGVRRLESPLQESNRRGRLHPQARCVHASAGARNARSDSPQADQIQSRHPRSSTASQFRLAQVGSRRCERKNAGVHSVAPPERPGKQEVELRARHQRRKVEREGAAPVRPRGFEPAAAVCCTDHRLQATTCEGLELTISRPRLRGRSQKRGLERRRRVPATVPLPDPDGSPDRVDALCTMGVGDHREDQRRSQAVHRAVHRQFSH